MLAWGGARPRRRPMGGGGGGGRFPPGVGAWSRGRRLLVLASVLLIVGTISALVTDAMLRPSLEAWASSRAVNVATKAISTAVRDHLLADLNADALFEAMTDAAGDVVLIDYNMALLNRLRADAAHHIQRQLEDLTHEQLPMPLGLLTGLDFLAAYGPEAAGADRAHRRGDGHSEIRLHGGGHQLRQS